ncbi:hypothetical protein ACR78Z_19985 [Sphingobacterium thalpophilum]|uniref:Glycosyltransferase family 25 (LPS biosynthesis protein) n=1 Tax=Sphingobacterium thalpophilum TaxID=259 RepID=A0A4V6KQE7_9SPHI|nr:hypothetical protein [Sphingobacterium thalpophilum]VTR36668.1 Uncharacterised protein [Sphingobacterium thalpophilum]
MSDILTKNSIPVYIINLVERKERREHILGQFKEYPEFSPQIFTAENHTIGSFGLLRTFEKILLIAKVENHDYFIIAEDDHCFTKNYKKNYIYSIIKQAKGVNADIVSGGISSFETGVCISDNLFWLNKFTGAQFLIINRKFIETFFLESFNTSDRLDLFISRLSSKIFTIYPFISMQSFFGYSDATPEIMQGNIDVKELFLNTEQKLDKFMYIKDYYEKFN